jgi:transposase
MDSRSQHQGCSRCSELHDTVKQQEEKLAQQQEYLAEQQKRIERLEAELAKAKKNSRNSSKPPSGDIVNPPKKKSKGKGGKKRKIGGQPGHQRHERALFSPEELDDHWIWWYDGCPCCGGKLNDIKVDEPRSIQQVELAALPPLHITQHDAHAQQCTTCDKIFVPQFPDELRKAGLVGPRLTALVGFFKGACHMSFSCIRKYLRDVVGVTISRGMLRKLVGKVTASLEDPYEALLAMLPTEDRLNVDETGHKENGKRLWTWCFRAYLYTVYKISPSRGSDVLMEVLGAEFDGVLGCDYFSAYRKYMRLNHNVLLQFCLAHFIRDVKFLAQHPNKKNQAHGKRLLDDLRKLFRIIHRRHGYASPETFRRSLEAAQRDLVWDATMESPHTREAKALEERFYQHTESYFRFITEPNVEPTNNLAEHAMRFVAIHRRITQGTRSEEGRQWCERIWTVIHTCGQQRRSVFEFLCQAVEAHFKSQPAPSLEPPTAPDTS